MAPRFPIDKHSHQAADRHDDGGECVGDGKLEPVWIQGIRACVNCGKSGFQFPHWKKKKTLSQTNEYN